MKIYQTHYKYGTSPNDELYYGESKGELYSNREACEEEAKNFMDSQDEDSFNIPVSYDIVEIEIKDHYVRNTNYTHTPHWTEDPNKENINEFIN